MLNNAPPPLFAGSLIRPKVVRSVHYCPATKKTMERRYTDMTSLEAFPSSSAYPTKVAACFDMFTHLMMEHCTTQSDLFDK